MKKNKDTSILFLAKNKPFSEDAAELIRLHFSKVRIIFGNRGDLFPSPLTKERFDYVISYISPWIVPQRILDNTKIEAINFHPGPPDYPGIGCTNFAIYNRESEFGITVHHMKSSPDSGNIIAVERFPIFRNDTVYTLAQRCYAYIFKSFVEIFSLILHNKTLPKSKEKWKRKPFTRRELNDLCRITPDMSPEEIKRRIKATEYPGMPGAYMDSGGSKFNPSQKSLAFRLRDEYTLFSAREGASAFGSTFAHHPERKWRDRPRGSTLNCTKDGKG